MPFLDIYLVLYKYTKGIAMIIEKFYPKDTDAWAWQLGEIWDIDDIMTLVKQSYVIEIDPIFKFNERCFATNIAKAMLDQRYSANKCQIIVARNRADNKLMGWAWLNRGYFPPYTTDEVAEAAFAQMDLALSTRHRVTIMAQIIMQWELWCKINAIPVLISTSIREDQKGFVNLHRVAGFRIRGSFAFKRLKEDV